MKKRKKEEVEKMTKIVWAKNYKVARKKAVMKTKVLKSVKWLKSKGKKKGMKAYKVTYRAKKKLNTRGKR